MHRLREEHHRKIKQPDSEDIVSVLAFLSIDCTVAVWSTGSGSYICSLDVPVTGEKNVNIVDRGDRSFRPLAVGLFRTQRRWFARSPSPGDRTRRFDLPGSRWAQSQIIRFPQASCDFYCYNDTTLGW
jgi:hypothetical protein